MTNFKPSYVLGSEGPLANVLPNYEVRKPQILLAEDIQKAFEESSHLVAEAATGTGKSFAAILAAAEKSLRSETPVVISTHTIALQEQLFHKDIPFILQHLNLHLKVCLAKGRGNYVSLRRAKYAHRKMMSKNSDTKGQYRRLQSWISSAKTTNGSPPSKSDLPFMPSSTLWSAVRSDTDDCLGEKCPTFKDCHYQNSRKQLEKANIIVTNHTMVMLDRKMKGSGLPGILPDYQYLILDEAHEIESVARQVFTFEMKESGIKKILGEIYSEDGLGILNSAYERFSQGSLVDILSKTEEPADPNKQIIMDTVHSVQGLLDETEEFFKKVSLFLGGKTVRRFTQPDEISTTLYDLFKVFLGNLKQLPKAVSSKHDKQKIDYVSRRCTEIALGLDKILTLPNISGKKYPEVVAWGMSKFNPAWKSKTLSVICSPIFLKAIMKRLLFAPLSSVVMMSATLATSGKDPFRTFKSIIGVDSPMQRRLPSVFDYQKQVKIYIVTDMPEQKAPNYISVLSAQVTKFVSASKGGALVLFTSFDTMKKVYGSTKDEFEMQGLELFLQGGSLSRNKMIEGFKDTKRGVLYGVASFWTGVDIPGNSLRTLIITKLPFTPPDDPLQQAQEQIYKQYKRSYFMERALPHTALMLKQGFGRLIRRSTDTGTVVLLDSRVVTKRYGKFLLNSLPSCNTKRVSHKAVLK